MHNTYKCNFCDRTFDKNQLLKVHLKEHSNLNNFCVDCNVIIKKDSDHICANKDEVNGEEVEEDPIESITDNM